MNHLHNTLHAMPTLTVIVIVVALIMGAMADFYKDNWIDTLGTWLSFSALIFGCFVWWWV